MVFYAAVKIHPLISRRSVHEWSRKPSAHRKHLSFVSEITNLKPLFTGICFWIEINQSLFNCCLLMYAKLSVNVKKSKCLTSERIVTPSCGLHRYTCTLNPRTFRWVLMATYSGVRWRHEIATTQKKRETKLWHYTKNATQEHNTTTQRTRYKHTKSDTTQRHDTATHEHDTTTTKYDTKIQRRDTTTHEHDKKTAL